MTDWMKKACELLEQASGNLWHSCTEHPETPATDCYACGLEGEIEFFLKEVRPSD